MSKKKLVLVIDDDPDILELIQTALSSEGLDVSTAKSGKEGITAVQKRRPDLILCDMMMESIDAGVLAAHEIKQTFSDIPIYLLSSIADTTADNIGIDELGFSGTFQKAMDPKRLVSVIKDALSR
jgi:CheY-like chemotaxis protein